MIADYYVIMEYILLGCLGGVSGLPQRRSNDYTEIKLKIYNTSKDNYYNNGKFVFNQYKTSKTYGEQSFDVKEKASEFCKILSKWIKWYPSHYLLFSSNQNKFTSSQITKLLNNIFDKRVSVKQLRHIYLTKNTAKFSLR